MGSDSILLVGCGNMGGAMLAGWLAAGIAPQRFTVADPHLTAAPPGVRFHPALADVTVPPRGFDVVLLGVKPQLLAAVAADVAGAIGPDTILLSILAGVELETLRALFPAAGGVVRVMPNLAAAIGKSPVALAARGVTPDDRDKVTALIKPLGWAEWLDDEGQFDLVTALAGSGPAFVYRFIDALTQAGAELGLEPGQAQRLAVAMVDGAAALAAASEHSPAELARRVASPGGVTQVGLDILDADQALSRLIVATLQGARDRSAEMAVAARG